MKLKNGTVLEVGKKYTRAYCNDFGFVTVTAIGRQAMLAIHSKVVDELGTPTENVWNPDDDWIPYERKKKEKWYEYLHLHNESEEETRYVLWYSNRPRLANVILLREWDSKEEMIKELTK